MALRSSVHLVTCELNHPSQRIISTKTPMNSIMLFVSTSPPLSLWQC